MTRAEFTSRTIPVSRPKVLYSLHHLSLSYSLYLSICLSISRQSQSPLFYNNLEIRNGFPAIGFRFIRTPVLYFHSDLLIGGSGGAAGKESGRRGRGGRNNESVIPPGKSSKNNKPSHLFFIYLLPHLAKIHYKRATFERRAPR